MKFRLWIYLLSTLSTAVSANEESFSFVVMADIHSLTPFSFDPFNTSSPTWIVGESILKNIKDNFGGGEFVVMVGDGASYGGMTNAEISAKLGGQLPYSNAVYQMGVNCHSSTKALFQAAGFDTLLPTVGDHELGGNNGFFVSRVRSKLSTVPDYRQAYVDGFFREGQQTGEYLFTDTIAGAPSRPFGTPFEGSSFAYRFKNLVVISVDAFKLVGNGLANYIDREQGFGGEGAITCDVSGEHLVWFENILIAARQDSTIRHIFVQAHLPIMQPVRKVDCSGQFLDGADRSEFWRLMNSYQVDIYFAGEVHSNTVSKTKAPNSNLIQIVSRSVRYSGFMTVHITEDQIQVKHYNEIGEKRKFNNQYEEDGRLTIVKLPGEVQIDSCGELELLDDSVALIYLDFEEITPLGTRQVLGLDGNEGRMANSIDIDGVTCRDSLENKGSFGKQYDAQIGNVQLVQGRPGGTGRSSARFSSDSRLAIYGTGPLSGGHIMSVSLWFKTDHATKEMVLVHYGSTWGPQLSKDHLLVTLRNGVPTFYLGKKKAYTITSIDSIADGEWHHLALTMPERSCRSSQIQMYIDGDEMVLESMMRRSEDEFIFFVTSGKLSFGGFGYGSIAANAVYSDKLPYLGDLDDVIVWSRTLSTKDILVLSATSQETSASPSPSTVNLSSNAPSPDDGHLCMDDASFKFAIATGKMKNCAWFGKWKTGNRIATYCGREEVNRACEKSCKACDSSCKDDSEFTFSQNGKTRKCAWLTKNQELTPNRISKFCLEDDGSTPSTIADSCSRSCGFCTE